MRNILALTALAVMFSACGEKAPPKLEGVRAFTGATLFDGRDNVIPNATLVVRDGRVDQVGASPVIQIPAGAETVVDANWRKGCIIADPRLAGEPAVDWDGQRGAQYWTGVTLADAYPLSGSSLIDTGKTLTGYDASFMTAGSDFSALPEPASVRLADQNRSGPRWDVGALIYTGNRAR